METHQTFSIDYLVRTNFSCTGSWKSKVVAVGTPTLNTPLSGDINPMEWLMNPVGLNVTPRYKVSWEEVGEIISPVNKSHAPALA